MGAEFCRFKCKGNLFFGAVLRSAKNLSKLINNRINYLYRNELPFRNEANLLNLTA